jgi:hypothetical protein
LLEKVGWRHRIPLERLVHFDNWGSASPGPEAWLGLREALKEE